MKMLFNETEAIDDFLSLVADTASDPGVNSLMILSCDENSFEPHQVDKIISGVDIPVFGGIFPAVIHGDRLLKKGNVVVGLPEAVTPVVVEDLSDTRVDFETLLDEKIPDIETGQTMMVFVDGFARRISAFIENLFIVCGLEMNYVGGGAGSLDMTMKPCLFTNAGLKQDCAVLVRMSSRSGLGVSHGWHSLKGPFRVTESDHNVIKTLDWQPAFELYKKIVTDHTGGSGFGADTFFDVAKAYPFGITRMGNEKIVRDPVMVGPDDSIVCVGEVPEGSFVSILNGDQASLVEAAGNALKKGLEDLPPQKKPGFRFVVDCISRVLFLEDRFDTEIRALRPDRVPMAGICSIGEIANCGTEFIEFYNKTCVVANIAE